MPVHQIIYNLAFSPKIRFIDISNVPLAGNSETREATFKLLKISGSIQTLLIGGTNFFNQIDTEFGHALGDNKTLEYIDISLPSANKTTIPHNVIKDLGKAIAMNKYRNGALKTLVMRNTIN